MFDGRGERSGFLHSLRLNRAAEFRSEVVPYFRYVVQSGFGLFVSAAMFALLIGYANLLRDVPADWPAGFAGAAAIAAAAVRSPLRTYLKPADRVYLLPMESAVLRDYVRQALAASVRFGILRTLLVYAVFLPLYIKAPVTETAAAGRPLWLLGAAFGAYGAWNAFGAWRERRAVHASHRILLRAARYAATVLSVGALLLGPPLPAFGVSAGLLLIVTLSWRIPAKHAMPWDKLIAEEAASRRYWYRFLGWFVDVPSAESRPAKRPWAAWIADRQPWERRWAWRYLYAKTFLRGETFSTWLRWLLMVAFIVLAADDPLVDWIAYGIGVLVGGVQLTELRTLRFAMSIDVFPIGREGRRLAAAAVARGAGTAGVLLLWLWTAIPQGWPVSGMGLSALVIAALWQVWFVPRRISKYNMDGEDE